MIQFNDDKKDKENNEFFLYDKNFEQCDIEEDESLYKKQLYVLEEDQFTKNDKSNLTLKHKALLNRLILEDCSLYPLKNDPTEISENTKSKKKLNTIDDKDSKKIDELEKFVEDENEFIKDLHRINYITFSPFSLSFFNKNNSSKEAYNNYYTNEKVFKEKEKENENKLFKMINFDYNNYEFNEDLLFNICNGFVDLDKLKEENIVVKNMGKSSIILDSDIMKNSEDRINSNIEDEKKENNKKEKDEEDEDTKINEEMLINEINELIETINIFIIKKQNIEFYKEEIKNYNQEKEKLNENSEISYEDKKNFYQKWLDKFHEIDVIYNNYKVQIRRTETIRKEREEKKKKQIEEERKKKINEDNKFIEELNKIRDKALQKKYNEERGIMSNNSSVYSDNSKISISSGFKGSSNISNLRGSITSKLTNADGRKSQKKVTGKKERSDWMLKKKDNYFYQY